MVIKNRLIIMLCKAQYELSMQFSIWILGIESTLRPQWTHKHSQAYIYHTTINYTMRRFVSIQKLLLRIIRTCGYSGEVNSLACTCVWPTRGCLTSAPSGLAIFTRALGDVQSGEHFRASRMDTHSGIKVILCGPKAYCKIIALCHFAGIRTNYMEPDHTIL